MKDRISPGTHWKPGSFWTTILFGPALLWTGCATPPAPTVSPDDVRAVQQRVEDVERTNGRMIVRVEEMERQVALMQDRVESNRIVLQRRGYLRQRGESYAQAPVDRRQERPDPTPQSNYSHQDDYQADPTMDQRIQSRGGGYIPLSREQSGQSNDHRSAPVSETIEVEPREDEGEEIIITNEQLEQYFGSESSNSSNRASRTSSNRSSSSNSNSGSSGPTAQAPVTSERLATSSELNSNQQEQEEPQASSSAPRSQRELLELYQDSLSQYRGGDYREALQGFTDFLAAGPRDDYIDNALYWIGECHYGLGQFETSISYFQRILDDLNGATKVPDAMLKMSLAYDQIGQPGQAVDMLKKLTQEYPRSNPGRLGAERLAEHSHYDGE